MLNRFFSRIPLAATRFWPAGMSFCLAWLAAALLAGCSEYYIPPPSIAVTITNPSLLANTLPLATTDSSGNIVASTLQCTAVVQNTTKGQSTAVTWAIQDPNPHDSGYLQACPASPAAGTTCATLGTISSTGLYTAPSLLPQYNSVIVMATSVADPTQIAYSPLVLQNPEAMINSVSPAFLTAGSGYTLDIKGQYFYPTTTVSVTGAQAGAVTPVNPNSTEPFGELTVPIQISLPGLVQVQAANPQSGSSVGNAYPVIGQPSSAAASSAIAVQIEQVGTMPDPNNAGSTLPVYGNTAFVPLTATNALVLVNADAGAVLKNSNSQPLTIAMPAGFAPTAAAANPAHDTVAVISATTPDLVVVDAVKDTVVSEYPIPVNTTASFSDGSCAVCAVVVDSIRNLAVLDTASGYLTMDLATGKTSAIMNAPAAENFAYDPNTQTAYIPYYNSNNSGLDLLNLATGQLSSFTPQNGASGAGAQPDSAAYDLSTGIAVIADESSSNYALVNFNRRSVAGSQITAPSLQFPITTNCTGAWDAADLEFSSHLGWFANEGGCVALVQLPTAPVSGSLSSPAAQQSNSSGQSVGVRWASLGAGPDGVNWTAAPHALATYLGMDGNAYGLALRADRAMLVKVNLKQLFAAPAPATPADANQVDPTATVNNAAIVNYIPLP